MAESPDKKEPTVEVPLKLLTEMQDQMASYDIKMADLEAKNAGIEALIESTQGAEEVDGKLREKKNFEPKFRTARIRKYPVAGDETDLAYVIGWTNRGAYQEVDRTGVSPAIVDCIDLIFLGHEKTKEGKLKAEKVRLLDFMNKGVQVNCKILEHKSTQRKEPTGEEINITIFDPQHGMIATGEKIDGYTSYSDTKYLLQIPGQKDPVWIDGEFLNA